MLGASVETGAYTFPPRGGRSPGSSPVPRNSAPASPPGAPQGAATPIALCERPRSRSNSLTPLVTEGVPASPGGPGGGRSGTSTPAPTVERQQPGPLHYVSTAGPSPSGTAPYISSAGPSPSGSLARSGPLQAVASGQPSPAGSPMGFRQTAPLPPLHQNQNQSPSASGGGGSAQQQKGSTPPTSALMRRRSADGLAPQLKSAAGLSEKTMSTDGDSSTEEAVPHLGASLGRLNSLRIMRRASGVSTPASETEVVLEITCGELEAPVRFYRSQTGDLTVHGPGEEPGQVAKLSWGPDGFLYVHLVGGSYRSVYVVPEDRTTAAGEVRKLATQAKVPVEYLNQSMPRRRSSFGMSSLRADRATAAALAAAVLVASVSASRSDFAILTRTRAAEPAGPPDTLSPYRRRDTLPAGQLSATVPRLDVAAEEDKTQDIRRTESMPTGVYEQTREELADYLRGIGELPPKKEKKKDPASAHAKWLREQGLAPAPKRRPSLGLRVAAGLAHRGAQARSRSLSRKR